MNIIPEYPSHVWSPDEKKRRSELLSNPIKQLDIEKFTVSSSLMESWRSLPFQAGQLSAASDCWIRWAKRDVRVIWSLAGSIFSAGLRKMTIQAIKFGLVDAIVCTGALIEQDMLEALGHQHYIPPELPDDDELNDLLIDRVWDHLLDELAIRQVDLTFASFAEQISPSTLSSRSFLSQCGAWLSAIEGVEESVMSVASLHDVPIFVPALNDSSVGVGLAMAQQRLGGAEKAVRIDSISDFAELAEWKAQVGDTGLVICGGGVPKNYAQDSVVLAEMLGHVVSRHRFGIQISVADTRDGGLSGSTLREAISWGKNAHDFDEVMVWGEATILFPLLVGSVLHQILG